MDCNTYNEIKLAKGQMLCDSSHFIRRGLYCVEISTISYHPDLNHIVLIWADVKPWAMKKTIKMKIKDVQQTYRQKFEETGEVELKNISRHVGRLKEIHYEKASMIENIVEHSII
jgi:hypothetical protein